MNKIALSLFCLFVALVALAQPEFEARVYKSDLGELNYRILYPENFSTNQAYPVLLFLHGAGERGADNQKQLVHGSKLFSDASFRKDYPAIVVFPQCPRDDYWSNVSVDRSFYPLRLLFQEDGEATSPLQQVMGLMDSLYALPFTKNHQFYLGGLSMGGMGTFELAARKSDIFAAAFSICGGGHPAWAEQIAGNVPMWVFHGAKDDVVLPSHSTEMVIAIREQGGVAKYTLYTDANHNSWDPTFAEPKLMSWLFSNVKGQ
ncbi:MAG: dienelactone hydrolase family protein [Cyclobacteriaceae bacterium]